MLIIDTMHSHVYQSDILYTYLEKKKSKEKASKSSKELMNPWHGFHLDSKFCGGWLECTVHQQMWDYPPKTIQNSLYQIEDPQYRTQAYLSSIPLKLDPLQICYWFILNDFDYNQFWYQIN